MCVLKKRLMSDENIFLSIHLVDSYIFNKELLCPAERKQLYSLKDIFNTNNINNTIDKVRSKLEKIINDENEYFESKVFFKPKKIDENGDNVFRPLHTASLIDQIAMIAMLQVLVYDIDAITEKLVPSELSKLLPSNFYGNRISYDGMRLFKPWQQQYKDYTSKANDVLYTSSETLEYKYEVNLDLENFFPSINPQVLFSFITNRLPLKYNSDEEKILHIVLKKLLVFKLSPLNTIEKTWYIQKDWGIQPDADINVNYVKGMPQGLPHTYFMANIFMLMVQEKYRVFFPGEMLFYVDDSVIFTNGINGTINEDLFNKSIDSLNISIEEYERSLLEKTSESNEFTWILPNDYCFEDSDYGVKVHSGKTNNSKSAFSRV